MCGIFGYVGRQGDAAGIVLRGLKELEYRGYDSWGIAVAHEGGAALERHVGKIGEAITGLPPSPIGLGHTRWATHGGVTEPNAHPHADCTGRLALIHNGIVSNYRELRNALYRSGHRFRSETDTEVVAHLLEDCLTATPPAEPDQLVNAVMSAFRQLQGLNAIAVRGVVADALGFTVIGEERGGEASADDSPYWLVDPICGTRNFASGILLYCVNLALVEGDAVTIAVVGDPSTGEMDVAERGRGAWALRDGTRDRLTTSDGSRTIVVEDGKAKGSRREQAAQFTAAAIRADRWDFRSLGTTLASPYLAAGRISAYVLFWVSAVHAGPGSLLVTEAGGTVSDIDGRSWTLRSDSFFASANPGLHEELLDLARASRTRRSG
jgi:fructose-1,6-bisphosphatase/inositol monophosphatase family enzyme